MKSSTFFAGAALASGIAAQNVPLFTGPYPADLSSYIDSIATNTEVAAALAAAETNPAFTSALIKGIQNPAPSQTDLNALLNTYEAALDAGAAALTGSQQAIATSVLKQYENMAATDGFSSAAAGYFSTLQNFLATATAPVVPTGSAPAHNAGHGQASAISNALIGSAMGAVAAVAVVLAL